MAARAYRHQHLAPAPRGWRVRSKRAGDHVLRVAFPPGRRRRGAGKVLEILHPKKNPACESGECAIAQNPVEELLIFGNPSKRNAGEYVKAIADRLEGQYREKRKEGMGHEEALTSTIAHAGGGDPKVLAEFKRRVGNPGYPSPYRRSRPRKAKIDSWGEGYKDAIAGRKRKSSGQYYKAGYDHGKTQLHVAGSNPSKLSAAIRRAKREALSAIRKGERIPVVGASAVRRTLANAGGGIGNHKPGCNCAFCKRIRARGLNPRDRKDSQRRRRGSSPRRRRNQGEGGELRQAVSLFETFHGRNAEEIAEKQESAKMRLEYTSLGDLDYLIIKPEDKAAVKVNFEEDGVKLASAPNGRQLYAIGGNQNLSSMLDKFTDDPEKDFIDLGEGLEVQYTARKIHTNFEPTEWFHKFGEKNGALPRLMYDKLKKRIFFVGGEYFIDTTDPISPGIEN